jgi:hypothetical protein
MFASGLPEADWVIGSIPGIAAWFPPLDDGIDEPAYAEVNGGAEAFGIPGWPFEDVAEAIGGGVIPGGRLPAGYDATVCPRSEAHAEHASANAAATATRRALARFRNPRSLIGIMDGPS